MLSILRPLKYPRPSLLQTWQKSRFVDDSSDLRLTDLQGLPWVKFVCFPGDNLFSERLPPGGGGGVESWRCQPHWAQRPGDYLQPGLRVQPHHTRGQHLLSGGVHLHRHQQVRTDRTQYCHVITRLSVGSGSGSALVTGEAEPVTITSESSQSEHEDRFTLAWEVASRSAVDRSDIRLIVVSVVCW